MSFNPRRKFRSWHRIGAIITAIPFVIVIVSGLLLQVKKEFAWIQPPSQNGSGTYPSLSFDSLLTVAQTVDSVGIQSWQDIDRLDVRPDKGITKIRGNNRWEIQIDHQTGEILQVAYRRSDLFEAIHDGSWFHDQAKLWIFLPSAVIVFLLWCTGIYLFALPYTAKRRNRKRLEKRRQARYK
jgi:uncharacterized iron-regulated membrane protein